MKIKNEKLNEVFRNDSDFITDCIKSAITTLLKNRHSKEQAELLSHYDLIDTGIKGGLYTHTIKKETFHKMFGEPNELRHELGDFESDCIKSSLISYYSGEISSIQKKLLLDYDLLEEDDLFKNLNS